MLARRTLLRYGAVAAIVVAVGGAYAWQQRAAREGDALGVIERSARARVGARAPDFALEDAATGRLVRLSEHRGKTVVLNFWATWCVPCREEMPDLQRAFEARAARGDLVVIGVDDKEPASAVTAFAREVGVTFPLLLDRVSDVRAHYGVVGLPGTFLIDREGIIRGQLFGPVGERLVEGIAAADRAAGP